MEKVLTVILILYFVIGAVFGVWVAVMGTRFRAEERLSLLDIVMCSLLAVWVWPLYTFEIVKKYFNRRNKR